MKLIGKILAFVCHLSASLVWFAAVPKDWDPDLKDFEVRVKDGYLEQVGGGEGMEDCN